MVIFLGNDVKLALAIDVEWRESTSCFGGSATRLYQVNPEFKILGGKISFSLLGLSKPRYTFTFFFLEDKNIVLFNEKTRGLPVGLILGSNPSKPQVSLLDGLATVSLGYLGGQESSVRRIQVILKCRNT